ncbi:nucleopolyhedrovirus P10 family protein [Streptomyces sp. NPDC002491]
MTADGWTGAVRRRLGLGRLLPLGGPRDGAWLTEAAAEAVLRRAARDVAGVRLGVLRLGLADPDGPFDSAVPGPPSALPPAPLRMTAECAASASEPLPTTTARLRSALAAAAAQQLGLMVSEVDLRVTELLDAEQNVDVEGDGEADGEASGEEPDRRPRPDATAAPAAEPGGAVPAGDEAIAAAAALAVPGVTGTSGGLGRPVRLEERHDTTAALPRRHVQLEITTAAAHRTLDVALAVRAAVSAALPDRPTVSVLVTAVD